MASPANEAPSPSKSELKRRYRDLEERYNETEASNTFLRARNERLTSFVQRVASDSQDVLSAPDAAAFSKWKLEVVQGPQLAVSGLHHDHVNSAGTGADVQVYRGTCSNGDQLFMPRDALVILGVKPQHSTVKDSGNKLAIKVGNAQKAIGLQHADAFNAFKKSAVNQKVVEISDRGWGGKAETTYFLSHEGMVKLCCKLLEGFEGYSDDAFLGALDDERATAGDQAAAGLDGGTAGSSEGLDKEEELHQRVSQQLAWLTCNDAKIIQPSNWQKPVYCK